MTTENATQQGVFTPAHAGRANAMAEIAAKVHEKNAEDFSAFNEETGEIVKDAPTQPQKQAVEPPQDDGEGQGDGEVVRTAQEPSDDGLELLIVDGQERKVKREQVLEAGKRTLQKEAAADRRLEEANETLRRARAYEQGLLQRQPSSDAGGEQQASSDPANGNGVSRTNQATPDPRALVREELWIHDANKAAQRFKQEFEDIVSDPFAARLVGQLEEERLQKAAAEGSPLGDPWDAYKAHGEQIRSWLGKAKPKEQVQVSEDKQERKRSTVTVTGSTTRAPVAEPKKPLTTAELIERERERRKQGSRQLPISR